MRRLKALWLMPAFWPARGGIETFGMHLALGLRALGVDIVIVTDVGRPTAAASESVRGLQVVRMPFYRALTERSPVQLLSLQHRLAALAAEWQPDLMHVHLIGATPMALYAVRLRRALVGTPLLATVHDDVRGLRAGPDTALGQCLCGARWVTTDSQAFLNDVLALVPELAARASAIAPGLPPPAAPPTEIEPGTPQFLGLGRMVRDKGMDVAVAALARVIDLHPSARLMLAGDGPMREELQHQVAHLSLEAHVEFAGAVSDAERTRLIDTSLAVLMPSRHREGFGLVALEAAQRRRAVIAARAGALEETVTRLGNGLLTPRDDVSALAAAMCRLLDNPDEARRLGAAGYVSAAQHFRQDQCAASYRALYQEPVTSRVLPASGGEGMVLPGSAVG